MKIWRKLSALLASTSEEKHLEVDIPLDTPEDQGLSDNDKMVVKEIQEKEEGIITCKVQGSDKELDLSKFNEFHEQIFEYIKEMEG